LAREALITLVRLDGLAQIHDDVSMGSSILVAGNPPGRCPRICQEDPLS
jgi:hypothetical protein